MLRAQIRIVKIVIRNFIYEVLISLLISLMLGIIGLTFLKGSLLFLVQCYFLGFTLIDAYYEIRHFSIKESARRSWNYAGVSLAVGLVAYLLLLLPLIGALLGPIVGSVTATLAIDRLERG